jgi:hypothetical protein
MPFLLSTQPCSPKGLLKGEQREIRTQTDLLPPWLLNGLSLKLIESHYENNYGGALRRLNSINRATGGA